MIIFVSPKFNKTFNKRFKNKPQIKEKFKERIKLFSIDPNNKLLNNHRLKGGKDKYYSFSITGDIRVIYELIDRNSIKLNDIGTHNQVY